MSNKRVLNLGIIGNGNRGGTSKVTMSKTPQAAHANFGVHGNGNINFDNQQQIHQKIEEYDEINAGIRGDDSVGVTNIVNILQDEQKSMETCAQQLDESKECPICKEPVVTPQINNSNPNALATTTLRCGHVIHLECYQLYIKSFNECPFCKALLGEGKPYKFDPSAQDSLVAQEMQDEEIHNATSLEDLL
jgi:Ring finger domain